MNIKNDIMLAIFKFQQEELSLSSVDSLLRRLKEIADSIPDEDINVELGYRALCFEINTLETEDRLSYTTPEVSDKLNKVMSSFHDCVCQYCYGTGRLQVPGPTGKDYIEEPCPFCGGAE